MKWDNATSLQERVTTTESYTVMHANLDTLTHEQAFNKMVEARIIWEDRLGSGTCDLALPGGFAPRRFERLARAARYTRVFTSVPLLWNGCSMCIPRICMRDAVRPTELEQIIAGGKPHYLRRQQHKYATRMVLGLSL